MPHFIIYSMTKRILFVFLAVAILSGCGNNEKNQEKALLDSVIKAHDKVMGDDDANMMMRSRLKRLVGSKPEFTDSVNYFLKKLDKNDTVMMDWMNKFNPDLTGKSHQQIMDYLESEKKKVAGIDSLMKKEADTIKNFYIKSRSVK